MDDLKSDIMHLDHLENKIKLSLQLDLKFIRAQPITALSAFIKNNRTLDLSHYNDCKTAQELRAYASFSCGRIKDKSLSTTMIFT